MGPCELMDLIGLDTNFAVTESVFAANFSDKRYVPSLVQRELVDGGLLGRKSGRGFFATGAGGRAAPAAFEPPGVPPGTMVALHGTGVAVDRWAARSARRGVRFESDASSRWSGLQTRTASCASPRPQRRAGRGGGGRARAGALRPGRRTRAAARRAPRSHVVLRERLAAPGSTRRSSGCASSAGHRAASATCPAWSSRARSRCSSTKPATRYSRACARPKAPTWR